MGIESLICDIKGEVVEAREGDGKTVYVVKKDGEEEPIQIGVSGHTMASSCRIREGDRFLLYHNRIGGLFIEIRSAESYEVVHSYEQGTGTRRPSII